MGLIKSFDKLRKCSAGKLLNATHWNFATTGISGGGWTIETPEAGYDCTIKIVFDDQDEYGQEHQFGEAVKLIGLTKDKAITVNIKGSMSAYYGINDYGLVEIYDHIVVESEWEDAVPDSTGIYYNIGKLPAVGNYAADIDVYKCYENGFYLWYDSSKVKNIVSNVVGASEPEDNYWYESGEEFFTPNLYADPPVYEGTITPTYSWRNNLAKVVGTETWEKEMIDVNNTYNGAFLKYGRVIWCKAKTYAGVWKQGSYLKFSFKLT